MKYPFEAPFDEILKDARGKVFTLKTLGFLIEHTRLKEFSSK